MDSAVIYVTRQHIDDYTDRCAEYCNRLNLSLAAVVVDDGDGARWPEAAGMLMDGTAQVLVVFDRDELPPARTPRVDVVAEQRRHLGPDRVRCRPRLLH